MSYYYMHTCKEKKECNKALILEDAPINNIYLYMNMICLVL